MTSFDFVVLRIALGIRTVCFSAASPHPNPGLFLV
jgi:hypothetical protein